MATTDVCDQCGNPLDVEGKLGLDTPGTVHIGVPGASWSAELCTDCIKPLLAICKKWGPNDYSSFSSRGGGAMLKSSPTMDQAKNVLGKKLL